MRRARGHAAPCDASEGAGARGGVWRSPPTRRGRASFTESAAAPSPAEPAALRASVERVERGARGGRRPRFLRDCAQVRARRRSRARSERVGAARPTMGDRRRRATASLSRAITSELVVAERAATRSVSAGRERRRRYDPDQGGRRVGPSITRRAREDVINIGAGRAPPPRRLAAQCEARRAECRLRPPVHRLLECAIPRRPRDSSRVRVGAFARHDGAPRGDRSGRAVGAKAGGDLVF